MHHGQNATTSVNPIPFEQEAIRSLPDDDEEKLQIVLLLTVNSTFRAPCASDVLP
jgi:hypothetical protein